MLKVTIFMKNVKLTFPEPAVLCCDFLSDSSNLLAIAFILYFVCFRMKLLVNNWLSYSLIAMDPTLFQSLLKSNASRLLA